MIPMRICIVPEYPASLMTGGLQVQADETYQALCALGGGLEAELFNWSERRPLADLYHFIGFPPHLHRIAELLRQAGRPYLITKLFGSSQDRLSLALAKLRRVGKSHLLRQRQALNVITGARFLITVTEADAAAARIIYSLPASAIQVIPHGVGAGFFSANADAWRARHGAQPFVLCVGAIQSRKGQLLLARACNRARLPLTLLGPVLPGEQAYAAAVEEAMRTNQSLGGQWLQGLSNEDALLVSAYGACRLFVLLSEAETQPISVMQAMAAGKPVLLRQAPYTGNSPFAGLSLVQAQGEEATAQALIRAWNEAKPSALDQSYAWTGVARQLQEIYRRALTEKPD